VYYVWTLKTVVGKKGKGRKKWFGFLGGKFSQLLPLEAQRPQAEEKGKPCNQETRDLRKGGGKGGEENSDLVCGEKKAQNSSNREKT